MNSTRRPWLSPLVLALGVAGGALTTGGCAAGSVDPEEEEVASSESAVKVGGFASCSLGKFFNANLIRQFERRFGVRLSAEVIVLVDEKEVQFLFGGVAATRLAGRWPQFLPAVTAGSLFSLTFDHEDLLKGKLVPADVGAVAKVGLKTRLLDVGRWCTVAGRDKGECGFFLSFDLYKNGLCRAGAIGVVEESDGGWLPSWLWSRSKSSDDS